MTEMSATDILLDDGQQVTTYLRDLVWRLTRDAPRRLRESIQYSLFAGGKRVRPALVLECARACLADAANLPPSALAAAGAIELIHTFSLVHDDLPAMDDDDLRRGQPTNHKVFGEAMAILAGDAMVTLAFEALATDTDPTLAPRLMTELSRASGPAGMIGGQVLDIDSEQRSLALDQLQHVHRLKTGALLTCACRLGAIASGATEAELAAVTDFGRHLGLAFQIVDDLLDITASTEQLGKATGKDTAKGKNTYPNLLGIDASGREAASQLAAALAALAPFSGRASRLKILANFVVERRM